jgi:lipopolysaccharide transport system permease protein
MGSEPVTAEQHGEGAAAGEAAGIDPGGPTGDPRADLFGHAHVTVIAPRRGLRRLDLRELWAYRELLAVLAGRDVRVRYKQTVLGAAWAVVRPLLGMVVFTVIFGRLAQLPSEGAPYPVFVFAGLLPWTFFSTALAAGAESLVGAQGLISKIYFPRLLVPLAQAGVALVDLAVALVVLLGLTLAYGVGWSAAFLWLPALVALLVVSTLGPTILLSALTVAYRDFRHVTPFLLQVWMYATPVVFPATMVPERWRPLLYLNPVAGPVEGFRAVVLGRPVDLAGLSVSLGVAVLLLLGSALYFARVEERFADIV